MRSLGCTARAVTPKGLCTERGLEATDRSRALQVALRHNCTGQTAVYTTQTECLDERGMGNGKVQHVFTPTDRLTMDNQSNG